MAAGLAPVIYGQYYKNTAPSGEELCKNFINALHLNDLARAKTILEEHKMRFPEVDLLNGGYSKQFAGHPPRLSILKDHPTGRYSYDRYYPLRTATKKGSIETENFLRENGAYYEAFSSTIFNEPAQHNERGR